MGKILIVLTLMVSAIIIGCASKPEQPAPPPEPKAEEAPKAEVIPQAEVVQKPKLSDPSARPEWTLVVPEPKDGYIFYYAVSGKWVQHLRKNKN